MTVCRAMTWRCVLLSAILVAITYSMAVTACRQGWFGHRCQYKCHCTAKVDCPSCNRCDGDGECSGGTVCEPGWFGPACQYVDMANTSAVATFANGTTLSALTDGDDESCLRTPFKIIVIYLRWNESFQFTWLRLHVNKPDAIHDITVEFTSNGPQRHDCNNPRNATVNGSSLDVYCDLHVPINAIKLRGRGVQALCSVYVSGGRNVALLGNVEQSSTFGWHYADNAVDGNTNSYHKTGQSCTHTSLYEDSATWSIEFSRPQLIKRVQLYNRIDCCGERLQGFILRASSRDNKSLSYQDNTGQIQAVYRMILSTNNTQISRVSIEATFKDPKWDNKTILTLCEVEIYGDTVCPEGTYGRDCEKTCNCSGECFVSTGGCPAGCPAGYQGENCLTRCSNGYYGANCKDTCSPHCGQNGDCLAVDGVCVHGCEAGYMNPTCNDICFNGYFGANCKDTCSPHCGQNGDCRAVDGVCVHGCEAGYMNPTCNESCSNGYYGVNCKDTCSPHCGQNGDCRAVDGVCVHGCEAGYMNPTCNDRCFNGYFGVNCKDACSPHCGQNGDCRAVDGVCVHGCEAGYMNPTCNESCSNGYYGVNCKDTCSPHCVQNGDCRAVDGVCVHGCEAGYMNPTCNDSCSNGYYGVNCKDTCSPHCGQNGDCRAVDGVCVHGCEAGYMNPTCNDTCGYQLYGLGCSNNCSRKCVHDGGRVCEPISGNCLAGCRTDYNGSDCQVVTADDPQLHPSPVGAVIGAVVAVILVVAAAIIAFICWRRRRYSTSDGSIDNSNEGDSNSFPEDKM